jgi:hypothetical protein
MSLFNQSFEDFVAKVMFYLTILFLSLVAIVIQYLQIDNGLERLLFSEQIVILLWILWPVFFLERLLYLIFCDHKTWKSYLNLFLITLIPPLRLAARRCHEENAIWWKGAWQTVDKELHQRIEKQFLYPILIVSLFMIPFWITEIFFPETLYTKYGLLYMITHFGNALIWGLFVTEFTLMISITPKRFDYLITHWLELLIIILPMLALTRFIFIAKYLKLSKSGYLLWFVKLQDILNIYRARSVLHRIIRILVIIDIMKRLFQHRNPKKYLLMLRKKLAEKEEEIEELKKQIHETELLIEKKAGKKTDET